MRACCTLMLCVCDDVDNGLDNTCEVIRQETVEVSLFITSWFYNTCEVIRQETVEVSAFITSLFYSLPLKLIT